MHKYIRLQAFLQTRFLMVLTITRNEMIQMMRRVLEDLPVCQITEPSQLGVSRSTVDKIWIQTTSATMQTVPTPLMATMEIKMMETYYLDR